MTEQTQKSFDIDDALFKETGLRISSIKDIRAAPPLKFIVKELIVQGFIHYLAAPLVRGSPSSTFPRQECSHGNTFLGYV